MAVLPRGCGKHQPGLGMNLHEDVHPLTLRGDEAVLFSLAVCVGTNQLESLLREGRRQPLFHVSLRRPADLIR